MVKFNDKGLEIAKNELAKQKSRLQEFFNLESIKKCLENHDIERLYHDIFNSSCDIQYTGNYTSDITMVLYMSGMDPLKYLDEIPEYCFIQSPLEEIEIPSHCIEIKEGAFSYCDYLKSVTIPNSVLHIGGMVFVYSKYLKELHYNGTYTEWSVLMSNSNIDWRKGSNIQKIICTDKTFDITL